MTRQHAHPARRDERRAVGLAIGVLVALAGVTAVAGVEPPRTDPVRTFTPQPSSPRPTPSRRDPVRTFGPRVTTPPTDTTR